LVAIPFDIDHLKYYYEKRLLEQQAMMKKQNISEPPLSQSSESYHPTSCDAKISAMVNLQNRERERRAVLYMVYYNILYYILYGVTRTYLISHFCHTHESSTIYTYGICIMICDILVYSIHSGRAYINLRFILIFF